MTNDRERNKDHRDDVAELVRLAGPRAPVPRERFERAKLAALATWRDEVQGRSRRRRAWTAAALAVAASLIALVGWRAMSPPGVGSGPDVLAAVTVESLRGEAWAHPGPGGDGEPGRSLRAGDTILPGSELTTAIGGGVAIRLPSGHSVRLDDSTRVRLLEATALALDRGTVYVDSGFDAVGTQGLSVHTPLGRVEELGTQFEVRVTPDAVRVRLREGAVVLHHGDSTHKVDVASELELGLDGSTRTRRIDTYGPSWDWVAGVAPMLDLEGRTARAFLDWVAHERGWRLVFGDEAAARSAEATVLAGMIRDMTLDQALAAVLPSCRLGYHVAGGVLRIDAVPREPAPNAD